MTSNDKMDTTILPNTTNAAISNSKTAIFGYTLGGAVCGYSTSRLFNGNILEITLLGTFGGLAMGLVSQNKRQTDSNENIAKTITAGYVLSKIGLPLMGVVILGVMIGRAKRT